MFYDNIISVENLLLAWKKFVRGKHGKRDVVEFEDNLLMNVLDLHDDLLHHTYIHGPYQHRKINDPKPRDIHAAPVCDRLLHHAIYRVLYPFFATRFIADSFSCQIGKGTHRALNRFRSFAYQVSKNHTRTAWVLKCDIRKFFANIDHKILKQVLARHISDPDTLWFLDRVIDSFAPGLPLGNLTSQLLVNIYMNEFDQYMKHQLKAWYYIRYADDFVIMSHDRQWLTALIPKISGFLNNQLKLELHPGKLSIKTIASGVDFLGWVHFPNHRVLRTSTKRRMIRRLANNHLPAAVASYRGMLQWGNTRKISAMI